MDRSKMSRRNSHVESAADVKTHTSPPAAFTCGLWFCFNFIADAQTFFWLGGNGDCGEVVDDVVERPSLLHVLLQHGHAVFDEHLGRGGREERKPTVIRYGSWKIINSVFHSWKLFNQNGSQQVCTESTEWNLQDVEPERTFSPAEELITVPARQKASTHTHVTIGLFARPNKAVVGGAELLHAKALQSKSAALTTLLQAVYC